MLGRGTVNSRLLELLDLNDSRKEIVLMATDDVTGTAAVQSIAKELSFHKADHGIAFVVPLQAIHGTHYCTSHSNHVTEANKMEQLIYTIVDKGLAEEVIEAAKSAGARGGTVINGRGSGIHETEMLFAMPIEPEREIILIIVSADIGEAVTRAIKDKMQLEQPGKGIMFVCNVSQTYGLHG